MTKQTTIFGYTNSAAFNIRPEGDTRWYMTRAERDAALSDCRAHAIRRGLSESASRSGIYPTKRVLRGSLSVERAAEMVED